jgi:hypothetical protein
MVNLNILSLAHQRADLRIPKPIDHLIKQFSDGPLLHSHLQNLFFKNPNPFRIKNLPHPRIFTSQHIIVLLQPCNSLQILVFSVPHLLYMFLKDLNFHFQLFTNLASDLQLGLQVLVFRLQKICFFIVKL